MVVLGPSSFAQQTNYLQYIRQHCDNLIQHGQDQYGTVHSHLLAGVIDTRDMSVPATGVPATSGTRNHDRSVGGSNFYHHTATIKVLKALSAITNDTQYDLAVNRYASDFIRYGQNEYTGLLAWGEHLYYNFFADSVMVGDIENLRNNRYHEFLASTPPWPLLWRHDSVAISDAIQGIRYHFRSPNTQSYLFNRHAYWHKVDKAEYRGVAQYQDGGQPWIKHSGLQCYSFAFLYKQTGDPQWKAWAEGTGTLYWNFRDPNTNLTSVCIDDPRPGSSRASVNQAATLGYFLFKASLYHPALQHLQTKAEAMLKSAEYYAWDDSSKRYYEKINLDGSIYDADHVPVISTGYGNSDILTVGRTAAYFYRQTRDPDYLQMIKKVRNMVLNEDWPDQFVINSIADALLFCLDAYKVTGDDAMLVRARELAGISIDKLWSGKMFVRQPGDPYYEAKLGTGSLVLGLLRLHLIQSEDHAMLEQINWDF